MSKIMRFTLSGVDTYNGSEWQSQVTYQTDVAAVGGGEGPLSDRLDDILEHFSSSGQNLSYWRATTYTSVSFTDAELREQVDPNSDEVGEAVHKALALAGSLSGPGVDVMPSAACVWLTYSTAAASRSARGGTHLPPAISAAQLTSAGEWDPASTAYVAAIALAAKILDPIHDYDVGGSDILPVVYSETRRQRAQEPFTFQLTAVTPRTQVRWLRSRMQ